MSELITRTARLTPYTKRPRQASGFVTAYSYEPAPDDMAAPLGNLLIVIEVLSSGRIAEEVVDIVIESIGQRYYERATGKEPSLLDRFEAAIKVTNAELSKYIDQGNAAWVGKMSAVIAVQSGSELHLAQTGSAEAFLARGRSNTRITASQAPRGPQANKTFGAITSGVLEDGDRILLATPALIHQISLVRLRTLMTGAAPASMINEIGALLESSTTSAERIAALAIEVMTPEQAALQLRSEEPSEVVMGGDESIIEVAKQTAVPITRTAVKSSIKLGQKAKDGIELAKPGLQRGAQRAAAGVRRTGVSPRGRAIAGGVLVVVVIVIITLSVRARSDSELTRLVTRYQNDAAAVQKTVASFATTTDRQATEEQLTKIKRDVTALQHSKRHTEIDRRLEKADVATGAPRTLAGLSRQIDQLLDNAESVERRSSINVAVFTAKMPAFGYMQEIGASLVTVARDGSAIAVVNPVSHTVTTSRADLTRVGAVVATGLNSAGDGVFILTTAHSVWLYKPGGDTLEQQTVGTGTWPDAISIASYNGNLYLEGRDGVTYKSLRTLSGYSPPQATLDAASIPALKGTRAIDVDGSVYALTASTLTRYLGGVAQASSAIPPALAHASVVRSSQGGATIVAVDQTTGRAGLFRSSSTEMTYTRQIALTSGEAITDALVDDASGLMYALTPKGIVSVTLQ